MFLPVACLAEPGGIDIGNQYYTIQTATRQSKTLISRRLKAIQYPLAIAGAYEKREKMSRKT